jgi:hypothetical protein
LEADREEQDGQVDVRGGEEVIRDIDQWGKVTAARELADMANLDAMLKLVVEHLEAEPERERPRAIALAETLHAIWRVLNVYNKGEEEGEVIKLPGREQLGELVKRTLDYTYTEYQEFRYLRWQDPGPNFRQALVNENNCQLLFSMVRPEVGYSFERLERIRRSIRWWRKVYEEQMPKPFDPIDSGDPGRPDPLAAY